MKKSFFDMKGSNIFFAICCLLVAIIFWFAVEYAQIEMLPLFGFIFS